MRFLVALSLLLPAAAVSAPSTRLADAFGQWAVVESDGQCDATTLALARPVDKARQASASIVFRRDGRAFGQVAIRLGRQVSTDMTIRLLVADQPFLLVSDGRTAWSRGPEQERGIIAALRGGGGFRVEGRDSANRRFAERFLGDGAASAIDSAAARCAR